MVSIEDLKRSAESGVLEVEDLLQLVSTEHDVTPEELLSLSDNQGWVGRADAEQSGVVPLADWAAAVAVYLGIGSSESAEWAIEAPIQMDRVVFVAAVLEAAGSLDAAEALLRIAEGLRDVNLHCSEGGVQIAMAFNQMLSFNPSFELSEANRGRVKAWLHANLEDSASSKDRVHTLYALRNVGDASSIDLIDSLEPLQGAFKGVEKKVKGAISSRI